MVGVEDEEDARCQGDLVGKTVAVEGFEVEGGAGLSDRSRSRPATPGSDRPFGRHSPSRRRSDRMGIESDVVGNERRNHLGNDWAIAEPGAGIPTAWAIAEAGSSEKRVARVRLM